MDFIAIKILITLPYRTTWYNIDGDVDPAAKADRDIVGTLQSGTTRGRFVAIKTDHQCEINTQGVVVACLFITGTIRITT